MIGVFKLLTWSTLGQKIGENIFLISYFANPCKWVRIGCKLGQNLRNLEKIGCNNIK